METIVKTPLTFTTGAVQEIKRLMQAPDFDTTQQLRIGVKGGGCSGMTYVLGFDADTKAGDQFYEYEGIPYKMEQAHELYLHGMEIDWQNGLNNRGFVFNN